MIISVIYTDCTNILVIEIIFDLDNKILLLILNVVYVINMFFNSDIHLYRIHICFFKPIIHTIYYKNIIIEDKTSYQKNKNTLPNITK